MKMTELMESSPTITDAIPNFERNGVTACHS